MDPKPARPGLVDEAEPPVRRLHRAEDFRQRFQVAGNHAVVAYFAVAPLLSQRHVDRFLVDIQPYEHATFCHDLPPLCVARRDAFAGSSNPR